MTDSSSNDVVLEFFNAHSSWTFANFEHHMPKLRHLSGHKAKSVNRSNYQHGLWKIARGIYKGFSPERVETAKELLRGLSTRKHFKRLKRLGDAFPQPPPYPASSNEQNEQKANSPDARESAAVYHTPNSLDAINAMKKAMAPVDGSCSLPSTRQISPIDVLHNHDTGPNLPVDGVIQVWSTNDPTKSTATSNSLKDSSGNEVRQTPDEPSNEESDVTPSPQPTVTSTIAHDGSSTITAVIVTPSPHPPTTTVTTTTVCDGNNTITTVTITVKANMG